MAIKLKKLNGKRLQFLLTEDEEKVLKIIYHQAKEKLTASSSNESSYSLLFTNRVGEELTGFHGVKLTKILQRLASLQLITIEYKRDHFSTYHRFRCVQMNCKLFDDKYYWAN